MGTNYYRVSDNRPDGAMIGEEATTDKVGFFGTTPVVQPTSASQAAAAATTTTKSTTTIAAALDAAVVLANQLRTELVALGLIKGS